MKRSFRRIAAAAVAFLGFTPVVVSAAPTGGVRIIVQEWSPTNPTVQDNRVVLDKPGLLGDAVAEGWARARGPACDAIKTAAGKPDLIGSGFTLYDIDCTLATSGTLTVAGYANNVLTLSYTLPGNEFRAKTTLPGPQGKYADPCVFIYYDVIAKTAIHLDSLAIDPFVVSIANVTRPDSCNFAGDVAKFAGTTYHFFGGPDYLALVQNSLQQTKSISTAPLNAAVASVVTPLQTYAQRYASRTNWIRNGNLYVAFAPVYTPAPLSTGISGTIAIPKTSQITETPDCSRFAVTGTVQTGPAPIYNPMQVTVGDPPLVTVGSGHANGTALDAGSRYTCAFTATGMPAGVPVTYRGSAALGTHFTMLLRPDGWSGNLVSSAVTPGKNFVAVPAPTLSVTPYTTVDRTAITATNHPNYGAGDDATLNPQPLPPHGTDPDVTAGNVLFARGDFVGAAAAFTRSHQAHADDPVALHNLALAHAKLGQTTAARSELLQAGSLARTNGDSATAAAVVRALGTTTP